jgi:hypothetical protein
MSYTDATPEPKKFFLNLLIKLDFEVASSLFRYGNWSDGIAGMGQILALINAQEESKLKKINDQMVLWQNQATAPTTELKEAFKTIQGFLLEKWFSELHLGIVQTSTLTTETAKPSHEALNPNQTSRL